MYLHLRKSTVVGIVILTFIIGVKSHIYIVENLNYEFLLSEKVIECNNIIKKETTINNLLDY